MQDAKPTIKPNNHKIHPCSNDRKIALLKAIISKNENKKIIITTAGETTELESEISLKNVEIFTDKTLILTKDLSCELLISYNLPTNAAIYMARLTHTTHSALLLLDKSEQDLLYPIETLLGRVIKQEIIEGYEQMKELEKPQDKTGRKPMSKEKIKEIAKQRYEASTGEKEKKEYSEPSKYAKKDDKYDKFKASDKAKPKYSSPKKKGRSIKITSLNKKSD